MSLTLARAMGHIVFAKPVLVFVPFLAEFATADYNQIIAGLLTSIPAKTGVPTSCRLSWAAARAMQRINSENESTRGHHHGAKPHLRPEHSSFLVVPSLLALVLGEFDDQNPVLRRHRDQHHEANLGVKIEREMKNPNTEKTSGDLLPLQSILLDGDEMGDLRLPFDVIAANCILQDTIGVRHSFVLA
jgi:hypothetical protein